MKSGICMRCGESEDTLNEYNLCNSCRHEEFIEDRDEDAESEDDL